MIVQTNNKVSKPWNKYLFLQILSYEGSDIFEVSVIEGGLNARHYQSHKLNFFMGEY